MEISRSSPNNSSSFWIGFGGSCLVHVLVVAGFYLYPFEEEVRFQSQERMVSFSLEQFQVSKPQEPTPPKPTPPKQEPKKRIVKKKPPILVPKEEIPKEELKKEEKEEEINQEDLDLKDLSESENSNSENIAENADDVPFGREALVTFDKDREFLARIHAAIAKHKKYPRQAQRMKMQGEVMVEFGLTKDGKIAWINVIQSSRHELLDEHALETIKKAASDFPPPKRRIRIKVPIAYYLT